MRGFYPRTPRFIPAGAGNTLPCPSAPRPRPVHPRRRGEHSFFSSSPRPESGSSPQARGTPARQPPPTRAHRFIPAGAGNTRPHGRRHHRLTVHPRRRGEHIARRWRGTSTCGSSPQARGTHLEFANLASANRFIPAGAGNTQYNSPIGFAIAVHPRRRGEHTVSNLASAAIDGSSPQARGTLFSLRCVARPARFIPAGAGNTPFDNALVIDLPVHPRRRGEHISAPWVTDRVIRFIPAGAGNTRGRMRFAVLRAGSSPQARGTPRH